MRQSREDQGLPGSPADARLIVRRHTLGDVPAVSTLRARSWRAAYTGIVPSDYLASIEPTAETVGRAEQRFLELGDRVHAFVADVDAEIVGFAYAGPDRDAGPPTGEIWAIYVEPAWWGAGVGRALLTIATDTLCATAPLPVNVWVLEDNERARGFYEHCGFAATGRRRHIDLGRPVPEVQYVLACPSHEPARR